MADSAPVPATTLVVGLGNPGPRYQTTRHNAGFMALDLVAQRASLDWQDETAWGSAVARSRGVHLLKPLRFMNCSGECVQPYAAYFRIDPRQCLVVLDDLALPLGKLRIRKAGSDGGHNGLASIIATMGTQSIPRLRIGIGSPQGIQRDYVLSEFAPDEVELAGVAISRAADAIESILNKGLDAAMNIFNTAQLPNTEQL